MRNQTLSKKKVSFSTVYRISKWKCTEQEVGLKKFQQNVKNTDIILMIAQICLLAATDA